MTAQRHAQLALAPLRLRPISPHKLRRVREETLQENARNTRQRTVVERSVLAHEVDTVEETVLSLWNADAVTVCRALEKLWKLLHHIDPDADYERTMTLQAFYDVGGHAFLVEVMNDHPHHRMIQRHGICVIIEATYKYTSLRLPIGKVKGIQAILTAMKNFPTDLEVISKGFCALRNLTCASEARKDHCYFLVTGSGELEFLVERMKHFFQNEKVMERFCGLILNLSGFAHLKNTIIEAHAFSALGMALERHKNNECIRTCARKAINLLTQY